MTDKDQSLVGHVARQVAAYDVVRPIYEIFAKVLNEILSQATKEIGVNAIIQVRAKDKASFAEKSVRKRHIYPDAVNQLTDLCGGRVIVDCKDDIDGIRNYINTHFEVSEEEDAIDRLRTSEFGYRSVHFIISLKSGTFRNVLNSIVERQDTTEQRSHMDACIERLFERHVPTSADEIQTHRGAKFKAEIQIRTLLQHAWSAIGHDRIYKSDFVVPMTWQRDAMRIAAYLEEADEAFSRTVKGVESYRNYFGAYLTREQQEDELERLEAVFRVDAGNLQLAHRIARLALSLRHWNLAKERLEPFVISLQKSILTSGSKELSIPGGIASPTQNSEPHRSMRWPVSKIASVFLDYGQALWQGTKSAGFDYMETASKLDPTNVDALVVLGETCLELSTLDHAHQWFEKAFHIAPEEPRALSGYLRCKIATDRNLIVLPLIRSCLEVATTCCKERANVKVYLPLAYYDMGLFLLLLGRPYESIASYAKAICLSDSMETAVESLEEIEVLYEAVGAQLPELDWIRKLLKLATVGKALTFARKAEAKYRRCHAQAFGASCASSIEDSSSESSKSLREATNMGDAGFEATDEVNRLKLESARLRLDATCLIEKHLVPLKSPNFVLVETPVIIVAGGTDRSVEQQMKEYQSLVSLAFEDFCGTVISGGTSAGVAGIVGDLANPVQGAIRKISYLPMVLTSDAETHPNYETHRTSGSDFSLLETLQSWIDLIASDVDPADVKVLGINGGQISASELRIDLMLGSSVGILRDSGRASGALASDPDWNSMPNLLSLPSDPQTVKIFVQGIPTAVVLDRAHKTKLAIDAHNTYRVNQTKRHIGQDPAMNEWQDLPDDIKNSNLDQIDHIEEKLRTAGMQLHKTESEDITMIEFSPAEIEAMAESEHGRWTLDRIRSGWRLGARSIDERRSPYLVSWDELSDEVKNWDRQAVLALPVILANLGYEIVRNNHT